MAKNWNYIFPSDTSQTTGTCVCVHENRVLIGGHLDSDTGGYNQIRYSDVGDPNTGFDTNYVNVGSSNEAIRYMFDLRGGLLVVKDHSIWLKRSVDPDGIYSTQFDPVIEGFSQLRTAALFDTTVFILTYDGLLQYAGDQLIDHSRQLKAEWLDNSSDWALGYWRILNWVICQDIDNDLAYIYDINTKRWTPISFTANYFTIGNPNGKCVYTDDTNQPKYINPASYTAAAGTIIFPFTDMGNAFSLKYLSTVYLNFKIPEDGAVRVRIWGRNSIGETPVSLLDKSGIDAITDQPLKIAAEDPFREICIRLDTNAKGGMFMPPAIEYEERRM